jgi:hypothetical protein
MKMSVSPLAWPLAAQDSSVRTVVVPTATMRPPRARSAAMACCVACGTSYHSLCMRCSAMVLGLHRLEGAGAHVQRDAGALHAARFQARRARSSKCRAAVGAATAPGFLANTVW